MNKLLLVIIFTIFMSSSVDAQSTLALQEKCADGAKRFIENHNSEGVVNHISHYNTNLDKCFIRIFYYFKQEVFAVGVYDAFAGSSVGSFFSNGGETIKCYAGDRECKNREEFERLIKPYMEE